MADEKDLERRIAKLETRVEKVVQDVNKVHVKAYDHITDLEKRFQKFDRWQKKTGKFADPKVQQKQTLKLVDIALKAYDQKKRK